MLAVAPKTFLRALWPIFFPSKPKDTCQYDLLRLQSADLKHSTETLLPCQTNGCAHLKGMSLLLWVLLFSCMSFQLQAAHLLAPSELFMPLAASVAKNKARVVDNVNVPPSIGFVPFLHLSLD